MNSGESKLTRDSILYILGGVLSSSISALLLIPILVSSLSVQEYGIISLVAVSSSGLSILMNMGTPGAYIINFHSKDKFFGDNITLLGILISLAFIMGLLLFFVFIIGLVFLKSSINDFDKLALLGSLTICLAMFECLIYIASTFFRINGRPISFLALGVSKVSILLCIILFLRFNDNLNDLTKIMADIFTLMILCCIFLWSIRDDYQLNFNKKIFRKTLIFGIPLIPHLLSNFLLTAGDRFVIGVLLDVEAVGIYSLGYQLSLALGIITMGFDQAWSFYYFKDVNESNIPNETTSKIFHIFSTFISFIALIFIFSIPFLFTLLRIEGDFYTSIDFMPLIIVGMVFQGVYFLSIKSLLNNQKTGLISIITVSCASFNIVLNIIFIPLLGIQGAAFSTFMSYLGLMIITTYFSQSINKVNISYFKTGLPLFLLTIFALTKIYPNEQIFSHLQVIITVILTLLLFLVVKEFRQISLDNSSTKI